MVMQFSSLMLHYGLEYVKAQLWTIPTGSCTPGWTWYIYPIPHISRICWPHECQSICWKCYMSTVAWWLVGSGWIFYSELKNPFHTKLDSSALCALPNMVEILLCIDGVINSTYPWLQNHSLDHVIWTTGYEDIVNLKQQYHGKDFWALNWWPGS